MEARTSREFADSLRLLFADPEPCRPLEENGRKVVVESHPAIATGARSEGLYAALVVPEIGGRQPGPAHRPAP